MVLLLRWGEAQSIRSFNVPTVLAAKLSGQSHNIAEFMMFWDLVSYLHFMAQKSRSCTRKADVLSYCFPEIVIMELSPHSLWA